MPFPAPTLHKTHPRLHRGYLQSQFVTDVPKFIPLSQKGHLPEFEYYLS